MDRTERFYRIDRLLRELGVVSRDALLAELEVSRATLFRDLEYMRERLNAPIAWDAQARGYRLVGPAPDAPRYALPGLWLSASELHGLLAMHRLLRRIEPGLLARQLAPLGRRLDELLLAAGHPDAQVRDRIRLLAAAQRSVDAQGFEAVAHATLDRRRLRVTHLRRSDGSITRRELSPQRLVYYRDNWYVDAWCHLRESLRRFAIDALEDAEVLPARALECDERSVESRFEAGYGVFQGDTVRWALIRFEPVRARWASRECWHPGQQGGWDATGSWLLRVPFSDPRELARDVLREGGSAEVIEPSDLRARVGELARRAVLRHAGEAPDDSPGGHPDAPPGPRPSGRLSATTLDEERS